jgi:hypothetical protein
MSPVGFEDIAQGPVSPAAKFPPVTRTVVPGAAEVGDSMTEGLTKKPAVP